MLWPLYVQTYLGIPFGLVCLARSVYCIYKRKKFSARALILLMYAILLFLIFDLFYEVEGYIFHYYIDESDRKLFTRILFLLAFLFLIPALIVDVCEKDRAYRASES